MNVLGRGLESLSVLCVSSLWDLAAELCNLRQAIWQGHANTAAYIAILFCCMSAEIVICAMTLHLWKGR